jgi:CRISPR-associated endonuclease/helicase Cas3
MKDGELYAKSKELDVRGEPPTVELHCRHVCAAAVALWDLIERNLADAMRLDLSELRKIRPLLLGAALLHDLGKANSAFQAMLRSTGKTPERQPVRHEILGGWLLTDPDFLGKWFAGLLSEAEQWPLVWAVAGHHLKMGDPAREAVLFETGSGTRRVTVHLSADQARKLLQEAAAALGKSASPPSLPDIDFETVNDDDDGLEQRIARFAETSCQAWNRLRRNVEVSRRTALLKALLISADVAASALTADGRQTAEWVPKALSVRLNATALDPVVKKGTKGKEPHPFQKEVGASEKSATIVIAGCGNGKTTAAYLWAQRHALGRKLWFTYPTTGTASAGYQGYLYDHPDFLTALMHGRAEVDLRAMRGTPEDDRNDEMTRLESLRAWDRQAVVCTVDTVLGVLQNQRRPLFSFPSIATGAFVFDEIHSYDARLFGSLLRFLETFPGLPVLLMSASIPPVRMARLQDALGSRVGQVIRGDEKPEKYKRYRLESRDSPEACRNDVADALRYGKKVLWVCNTVTEAVKTAQDALEWAGVAPDQITVYHSRFRYKDRVNRQTEVLAEFEYDESSSDPKPRKKLRANLVITTQVCEMSLDISADLLVTAECPLPSLVQRLGRLNRYAKNDDPWPCLVYPFCGDPYNERPELIQTRGDYRVGMDAARAAVRDFAGQPCSQRVLAARLEGMVAAEDFETYSAWLDDGWLTEPAQLRDGDASVTLIRQEDLAEIEREIGPEHAKPSKWTSRSLVPWTIPMLYRRQFRPESKAGGYPVAATGSVSYCEKKGASWQTNTN